MAKYFVTIIAVAAGISATLADFIQLDGKSLQCCDFAENSDYTLDKLPPQATYLLASADGPLQKSLWSQQIVMLNDSAALLTETYQPLGVSQIQTLQLYLYPTKKGGVFNALRQNSPNAVNYTYYRIYILYYDESGFAITMLTRDLGNNKYEAEVVVLSGTLQRNISIAQLNIVKDVLKKYNFPYYYMQVVQQNA